MGTRSLTIFQDSWEGHTEIAVMYRQFDGNLYAHGADLKEFLSDMTIVSGLSTANPDKVANGGGCLAAQIIAQFKNRAGGIYLYPAGTRNCNENYVYIITPTVGQPIRVKVKKGYENRMTTIYEGNITDMPTDK